jgi:hypothetical protein
VVGKVLASAVANAAHNDFLDPEELYVSACYADEGTTLKRWRPRARGRATRIRKRTCHITIIVSRLPEDRSSRAAKQAASQLPALAPGGRLAAARADLSGRLSHPPGGPGVAEGRAAVTRRKAEVTEVDARGRRRRGRRRHDGRPS